MYLLIILRVQGGGGGWGCLIDRRHLKERGVYSQDINKLNQTNNLWGKNIRRV